ncbi:arginine--tRNA ligase [bacterium]|nr:arginine--tRNA ligase [bacterium]
MEILELITENVAAFLKAEYQAEGPAPKIESTNPNFKGDFTVVVFPYLRISKSNPEATANAMGTYLVEHLDEISGYNVVKGFLNLELADAFWVNCFEELHPKPTEIPAIGKGQKVVVEYSSPNTNKPLHLGHIRNNVLGYSFCQILDANGYDVVKNNLVNDRGIHICKSMLAWQKYGDGETPESSGIKGDHLVGKYYVRFDQEYKKQIESLKNDGQSEEDAKNNAPLILEARKMLQDWEKGNSEVISLWETMNSWVYEGFDQTYATLGVSFDKVYYESDTYLLGKDIVKGGLESGVFYQKEDGSVWVDLTDEGLDHKILLRADGTSVYMTQDIGTAELKYSDFKMDQSIYVVGNEQDYHFKVLQLILKKLGRPHWEGLHHLSYGMVDLPSGKMKSREGTVVDADDLMAEMVQTAKTQTEELGKTEGMSKAELEELYHTLGIGALKYFLLKVDAKKRMLFDPQESIDFQGNTGPFIQYTYARIQSVLRAAENADFNLVSSLETEEKALIRLFTEYPQVVNDSARDFNPSIVANHAYELAKAYNKFYHQCSILGAKEEETKNFRLALSRTCGAILQHACGLLGMSMPERM